MDSEEVEHEQIIDEESISNDHEINVIPVQLVESYEGVSLTSPSASNSYRGKYYKQTYRPAWEQMPDFKGWLRGVEGEPTRAYCTYCQKTLHAHRLSLLKHTCTIRHQKAAQVHSNRKNRMHIQSNTMLLDEQQDLDDVVVKQQPDEIEDDVDTIEHAVEFVEAADMEDGEAEQENEEEEEEDAEQGFEMQKIRFKKYENQPVQLTEKPPISTHVTDTTRGKAVTGLQVSLYKLIDGRWTYINEGLTDSHGKFCHFLDRSDFTPGRYKLHYDVDRYFESKKQDTLFPFIEVVFDSTVFPETYHIPMALGPFGYTVYKGH